MNYFLREALSLFAGAKIAAQPQRKTGGFPATPGSQIDGLWLRHSHQAGRPGRAGALVSPNWNGQQAGVQWRLVAASADTPIPAR
jgi:hypothetical protein